MAAKEPTINENINESAELAKERNREAADRTLEMMACLPAAAALESVPKVHPRWFLSPTRAMLVLCRFAGWRPSHFQQ